MTDRAITTKQYSFKRNTVRKRLQAIYDNLCEVYTVPEITFIDFLELLERNVVAEAIFECYQSDHGE